MTQSLYTVNWSCSRRAPNVSDDSLDQIHRPEHREETEGYYAVSTLKYQDPFVFLQKYLEVYDSVHGYVCLSMVK